MNFDFFNTIRKSDRTEALNTLIAGSYPRRELFLVTALAAGIAGIGLITDDLVLIIGSMIVAPLLLPQLALGLGLAIGDYKLIGTSLKTIMIGTIVSVLFVIPIGLLLENNKFLDFSSYYSTIKPTFASSFVAILAGIVSAFAISKKNLSSSMAGVAIAVALVPPLAAIGIAISRLDLDHFIQTSMQYSLNVVIIATFSSFVFRYLHFEESLRQAHKTFKNEEKEAKREAEESNSLKII